MSLKLSHRKFFYIISIIPIFTACQRRGYNTNEVKSADESLPLANLDADYQQACEKNLGALPEISCASGAQLEFNPFVGALPGRIPCDTPLFAHAEGPGQCAGQHFVGTILGTGAHAHETKWSFLCTQQPQPQTWRVAAIGHNYKTGATCYFDGKTNQEGLPQKTRVGVSNVHYSWSKPSEIAKEPKQQCVTCHTSYPFVRTPAVLPFIYKKTARYLRNPQELPPLLENDFTVPPNIPEAKLAPRGQTPYWVVARKQLDFAQSQKNEVPWNESRWRPQGILGNAVKTCTGCHRVGGYPVRIEVIKRMIGLDEDTQSYHGPMALSRLEARNNHWTLHARWNGILKVFKTSATHEEYLAADRHVQTLKGVPPCLNNLTEGGECWVAPLPEPTEGK